jgi:hypothetical protein
MPSTENSSFKGKLLFGGDDEIDVQGLEKKKKAPTWSSGLGVIQWRMQ